MAQRAIGAEHDEVRRTTVAPELNDEGPPRGIQLQPVIFQEWPEGGPMIPDYDEDLDEEFHGLSAQGDPDMEGYDEGYDEDYDDEYEGQAQLC